MSKLHLSIIDTYSKLHTPTMYTNDNNVSFDGSQIQAEFFEAWDTINECYKGVDNTAVSLTFLEVGAWKGLWGLAFHEFCSLNGFKGEYTTITMIDHDINNRPLLKTIDHLNNNGTKATLIDLNTFDESALPSVLKVNNKYNIVFIDAGHKYNEVINDINKFSSLATDLLLFHDIRPAFETEYCGVYKALNDSNIILDKQIVTNNSLMGIGVKYVSSNFKS